MPVYIPSGAEHGATGDAVEEMENQTCCSKNENWTILEKVLYKSEKSDKIFKELREKTKRTPKYPVKHQVLLWNIVQK